MKAGVERGIHTEGLLGITGVGGVGGGGGHGWGRASLTEAMGGIWEEGYGAVPPPAQPKGSSTARRPGGWSDSLGALVPGSCLILDLIWAVSGCLLLLAGHINSAAAVLLPFVVLAARPLKDVPDPPKWLRRLDPVAAALRYFPIRVAFEAPAAFSDAAQGGAARDQRTRPVVLALEPHSVLPLSAVAFSSMNGLGWPPGFPGALRILASSAVGLPPLTRHFARWHGLADARRASARRLLARGESLLIVPGGVRETALLRRDAPGGPAVSRVWLSDRRGFVRLALEHRAHLVPAYAFGQDGAFGFRLPWDGLLMTEKRYVALARRLGFAPILFWGRFGPLPAVPFKRPMHVVVGEPVDVPAYDEVTHELVELVRKRFVSSLVALFDRHKTAVPGYGPHAKLHVL